MQVQLYVIRVGGDDPRKSTALKLVRLGLAVKVPPWRVPRGAVVLNPLARTVLAPEDRVLVGNHGLAVIDSSWNDGTEPIEATARRLRGRAHRVLPLLKAGNPINYAKPTLLSSAEALAAALYITGFKEDAVRVMSKFKWGETFLSLNRDLLDTYAGASSRDEVLRIQNALLRKYGIST